VSTGPADPAVVVANLRRNMEALSQLSNERAGEGHRGAERGTDRETMAGGIYADPYHQWHALRISTRKRTNTHHALGTSCPSHQHQEEDQHPSCTGNFLPFASAPGRGPTPVMHWELLALRISTRKRTNTRHALGTSCPSHQHQEEDQHPSCTGNFLHVLPSGCRAAVFPCGMMSTPWWHHQAALCCCLQDWRRR
jgi:hypothetical protein